METFIEYLLSLYTKFGPVILVPIILGGVVGVGAQWMLYEKCNLKGIASIVPVWNIIEFLKIMGRPAWQSIIVMVPPPVIILALLEGNGSVLIIALISLLALVWVIFIVRIYVDLCDCFGRNSTIDYIAAILFNGLYVLSLGLSYDAKYIGPKYKKEVTLVA
jgi:hypothetical protein